MADAVRPPLRRTVLTCAGHARTWADVVECARVWGAWAQVQRRADEGLAAAGTPAPASVNERVTAFRYAHDLISVDDTTAWFHHWGITVDAWLAHVGREVLREAGEMTKGCADLPLDARAAAAWIEGVCCGVLEATAHRLAARVAAHEALGEAGEPGPIDLRDAEERFAARVAGVEAMTTELSERRLDWTRLELHTVTLANTDAARELIHCIRHDRREPSAVAADAGLSVEVQRVLVADAPVELRSRLVGAQPGELFGPLPGPTGQRVLIVAGRCSPDPNDAQTRERAASAVVQRALRAEVARRVEFSENLS